VEHHTKSLYLTLGALIAAILLGIIMSAALPGKWNTALDLNLLTPVKTLYMNALKMIAAPVVFFSIISCISQLGSPSEFGRIGGKILTLYLVTSIIASTLGIIVFGIFRPGNLTVGRQMHLRASTRCAWRLIAQKRPAARQVFFVVNLLYLLSKYSQMSIIILRGRGRSRISSCHFENKHDRKHHH
jgi:Na+/H+-dicarboxylate symporter